MVGVYLGDSPGALTPVGSHEYPCATTFSAAAGTTYRIGIDGEFDAEAGGPALRSFSVNVSMQLPLQPKSGSAPDSPPSSSPTVDLDPPDTVIHKRKVMPRKHKATFSFRSSETGGSFLCKLDKRAFAPCRSHGPTGTWRRGGTPSKWSRSMRRETSTPGLP